LAHAKLAGSQPTLAGRIAAPSSHDFPFVTAPNTVHHLRYDSTAKGIVVICTSPLPAILLLVGCAGPSGMLPAFTIALWRQRYRRLRSDSSPNPPRPWRNWKPIQPSRISRRPSALQPSSTRRVIPPIPGEAIRASSGSPCASAIASPRRARKGLPGRASTIARSTSGSRAIACSPITSVSGGPDGARRSTATWAPSPSR